jgi:xanthine/CO dehydrogenase XdhC/CoxF family maturation factor
VKEVREIIRFWEERKAQPLALATLVKVTGSSYRRPGARMLISAAGEFAGGVSAGCIEEQVVDCAREVLRSGKPQLMRFDTRLRFGCHGMIDVFVEPIESQVLAELRDCFSQRQSCRLVTVLQGESPGTRVSRFDEVADACAQTIEPALRLILVGDSSETAVLRAQAVLQGWDVVQMDAWNGKASGLPEMLDDRTAVLLATHNFAHDFAALSDLLPMGLKYLGLVGSRRRREDLLFDLMQNSVDLNSSLFAPAGFHLGAESPEEIALSITAEIQSVFRGGTGQHLCDRKAPIHQLAAEVPA